MLKYLKLFYRIKKLILNISKNTSDLKLKFWFKFFNSNF